jgi:hypothetical protein
MGRLRSWKRELFARAIAEGVEPKKAYVDAGFKPSSVAFRNYNRLLKQSDVIGRINEFAKEREDRVRAARMPASLECRRQRFSRCLRTAGSNSSRSSLSGMPPASCGFEIFGGFRSKQRLHSFGSCARGCGSTANCHKLPNES